MRQGDARRWRVRGLPGFDRIFQNISNNYIQKKMGGVRCQEVTLSHSLRRRSPLQSFFHSPSVAICQEECLQYPETWKPPSSCHSFPALLFNLIARLLICQITGFWGCFCFISWSFLAMFCFHFWMSPQSREIGPKESCCSQN